MSLASRKLIQATAGATTVDTGDDDFANVVLLLDGDGTSGDNNETFTDSSTNGFTVTESGSVIQGSFSPYGDNWSNNFNSSDERLDFTPSFSLGSNDFTIEMWVNPSAASAGSLESFFWLESGGSDFLVFRINNSNNEGLEFRVYNGNNKVFLTQGSDYLENGEWVHVAATKSGSTYNFFVNGTSLGTATYATALTSYSNGHIGAWTSVSQDYAGYISNVRVVNGTALYTSNFTPPTSYLTAVTNTVLLTCQSNRFVDNSSSPHTLTLGVSPKVTPFSPFKNDDARDITTDGGSAYFNGSSDLASSGSVNWSTYTDITLEAWVYPTSLSSSTAHVLMGTASGASGYTAFYLYSDGRIGIGITGVNEIASSSGAVIDNEWQHVAAVKSGSTTTLYVNGTSVASATTAVWSNNSAVVRVGRANTTERLYGYMSDVRVVLGTAIVPSTLSTSPLTAVTNTELLLNFQDAGIYDRSGINNLDTVGDARLGFAPIYGTGSLAFDGTGDYLGIENTPELRFSSSSPFTIELWVNANVLSGDQHFFWAYDPSSPYTGWALAFGANSQAATTLMWWDGTSWTNIKTGMDANRWYHIAVCSEGSASTGRFFVDGVQQGSAYTIPSTILNTTTNIRLGSQNNAFYFNGYFDDVRITNGVARYTSNFTPPTEIDLSTDTHREYVTLFLDGDGTVNGQNNTFTDSSTNGFTVTESGSVVQGVFSPYGDNWSVFFDGSNDYIELPADSNYVFGTGDFTIEAWINTDGSDFFSIFQNCPFSSSAATDDYFFGVTTAGAVEFARHGGVTTVTSSTGAVTLNKWHHVAVTRTSSVMTIWVDGASAATSTDSNLISYNINQNVAHTIGWRVTPNYGGGYLSNLRVLNGTALYTTGFTVPTSPLTAITNTAFLGLQSNRYIDNSTVGNSITAGNGVAISRFSPFESDKPYDITTDGGSAYLTSSSEYLSVADNSAFDFGSGDFTIECWANTSSFSSAYNVLISQWNASSQAWIFRITSSLVGLYANIGGTQTYTASVTNSANQWDHFAVAREGSSLRFFKNGALLGTSAISGTIANATSNITVGILSDLNSTTAHDGYISDLRVVKGTAVYTSAFTPPTSPLTAVTNTELLLNFQDSAIPDLSGLNNIDTAGNAKVGGTDPTKYGSNAIQFDGSGDYLEASYVSDLFDFDTADWTMECWVYLQADSDSRGGIIEIYKDDNNYIRLFRDSGPDIQLRGVSGGTTQFDIQSAAQSQDTWIHIAGVRDGSTIRLFVDGTQVGTDTSFSIPDLSDARVVVGLDLAGTDRYFTGFIDDLRITKGVARYTANFTAPTDALPKF